MYLVVILFIVIAAVSFFSTLNSRKDLPPGIWGWPIIGKVPSLKVQFAETVEKYRQKYGDIFLWRIGSRNFLFLCNYDLIKTALSHSNFQERPEMYSMIAFGNGEFNGISFNIGSAWQKTRKLCMKYLKDRGVGKSSLLPEIEFERDCLIKEFKNMVRKNSNISTWCINNANMNVIWKMCADQRYDISDKEMQNLHKCVHDALADVQSPSFVALDFIPWLQYIVPSFLRKYSGFGSTKNIDILFDFIQKMIVDHDKNKDPRRLPTVIDAYTEEMKKGEKSQYYGALNRNGLLVTMFDLFTAGGDTTSQTIKWILLCLAKYPEIQENAYKEISTVVPADRYPCMDDKLPYCNAVFAEVMRYKTLLPFNFYHSVLEDTKLGKYIIPKGTIIMPSFHHCHSDPKIWERPNEFYPEHFLNKDGTFRSRQEGYLPFGIGPRGCIGQSLAKVNLFLFTTAILQQFEMKPADGEEISLDPILNQPLFYLTTHEYMKFCERN